MYKKHEDLTHIKVCSLLFFKKCCLNVCVFFKGLDSKTGKALHKSQLCDLTDLSVSPLYH